MPTKITFQSTEERDHWFALVAAGIASLPIATIKPPVIVDADIHQGLVNKCCQAADWAILQSRQRYPIAAPPTVSEN